MTTGDDPLADTVSLVASPSVPDPHASVTVQYAVLDPFEAPTRALAVPETLATTVWSRPVSPGAATELIAKPPTPRSEPRRRQLALVVVASVIAIVTGVLVFLVVRRGRNETDANKHVTTVATNQRSGLPTVSPTPPEYAAEVSATDRTELERVAVEALLSGDSQRARIHYQDLASRTGDEVFDRVVAVLERAP